MMILTSVIPQASQGDSPLNYDTTLPAADPEWRGQYAD